MQSSASLTFFHRLGEALSGHSAFAYGHEGVHRSLVHFIFFNLPLRTGEQIFNDRFFNLCVGNNVYTAEKQNRLRLRGESGHCIFWTALTNFLCKPILMIKSNKCLHLTNFLSQEHYNASFSAKTFAIEHVDKFCHPEEQISRKEKV